MNVQLVPYCTANHVKIFFEQWSFQYVAIKWDGKLLHRLK